MLTEEQKKLAEECGFELDVDVFLCFPEELSKLFAAHEIQVRAKVLEEVRLRLDKLIFTMSRFKDSSYHAEGWNDRAMFECTVLKDMISERTKG